mgnify:FL=1
MAKKEIKTDEKAEEPKEPTAISAEQPEGKSILELMAKIECKGVKVRRPPAGSDAAIQLEFLASLPKVRTRLPRSAGENVNAFETFIVDGLMVTIQKGVSVELPEEIANKIEESFYTTDQALNKDALKEVPQELQ